MKRESKETKKAPEYNFDVDVAKFTERQMSAVRMLDSGEIKYLLYGGALGGGKLLRLSTPIPTPDGWTTMGAIKVGDRVFDEKGNPCNVVGISAPTKDKTYVLTFSDGSEIVAGANHEWVTETNKDRQKLLRRSDAYRDKRRETRKKRGTGKRPDLALLNSLREVELLDSPVSTIKTTQVIADTLKDGEQINHAIVTCKPLNLPIIDLPIEPYVLGAWLGDGTSDNGNMTGIDEDIFDWIRYYGYEVSQHKNKYSHCVKKLKPKLSSIGLIGNKHIPDIYLRASKEQRLSLLQGLMDTDGYCGLNGHCEIQLISKKLIDGVYELLCSLGIKVQIRVGVSTLNGNNCGEKYRLKFLTDEPVFRIKRKLDRQKRSGFRGTHNRRYIVEAKEIQPEVMKCIQVDSPSHLYLAGESMIPTHNSYFLRWIAVRLLINYAKDYGLEYVQVMLACEDYPSLKDRQIGKMAREFPQWLGTMYVDHREYGRCFILNKAYGSGVICLRNLDDPAKYQSAEFAAILVDELTKNDLNTFTDLRMRLRWPGIPDMSCVFLGATNPGGVGHAFVKALWMDKIFPDEFLKPTDYSKTFGYIPSKAEDNPYLDDAYWAGLQTLPPHLRAAFRDGSWDLFKGQAFQEWSRLYHVVDPLYFEHKDGKKRLYPEGAPLFMTFDWGFGAPFSIGWWWIDSDGRKYRFSEWYGWAGSPNQGMRISDTEIAAGIIKREQIMGLTTIEERLGLKVYNPQIHRLCDPTCFNKKPDYRGGGQMPSTAEVFMNEGLILAPGDPSRALKYRQFHEHLKVPYDDEGKVCGIPMMQVYSDCSHFIRTIPALILDEHNIEDIDTDSEDHVFDEACHIMMHRPVRAEKVSVAVHRPPENISKVADLEQKQIWEDVKRAEDMENALYDY